MGKRGKKARNQAAAQTQNQPSGGAGETTVTPQAQDPGETSQTHAAARPSRLAFLGLGETSDRRAALLLALVFLLTSLFFAHKLEMPNEMSRLMVLDAMVQHQTFAIDHFSIDPAGDFSEHDGHYYSNKAPGQFLLAYPLYKLLNQGTAQGTTVQLFANRYLARGVTTSLFFALSALALFACARRMGAGPRAAASMTLAYGLGTIALVHAMFFGGHSLAASATTGGFCLLAATRLGLGKDPGDTQLWLAPLLAGLLVGVGAISDYTAMFTALVLTIYVLATRLPLISKAAFVVGGLPSMLALMAYNAICFGGPLQFSYHYMTNKTFAEGAGQGFFGVTLPSLSALWGILFSPARGLFFTMPVTLLALYGFYILYRTRKDLRPELFCMAGVVLVYLWLNAGFYGWHGGWTFGPRYLATMLPFLLLPLAFAPLRTWVFPLLLGLSLIQVVPAALIYNQIPEQIANPLVEIIPRLYAGGLSAWSWATGLGIPDPASYLLFTALLGALLYLLQKTVAERGAPPSGDQPPLWAKGTAVLAACLILGSLAVVRTPPSLKLSCVEANLLQRGRTFGALKHGLAPLADAARRCKQGR